MRQTATQLLIISGAFLPLTSYVHGTYFTIRSGGKTFITFLFDCVFTWVVNLPVAFCLCHFTGLSVVWVFFCVSCADIIKAIIGTAHAGFRDLDPQRGGPHHPKVKQEGAFLSPSPMTGKTP